MEGCLKSCSYNDQFHEQTSDEHFCGNAHSYHKKCESDRIHEDIVPKNASWRGVLGAVVTRITPMNRQVMNISVVMSMLVIRNVKWMEFVKYSLNLCDIHAHFRGEEVPLSMNIPLNKMVWKRIVAFLFHHLKHPMMMWIFTH